MSLSVQVNQYWQLGRVVLLPARFLRWLFSIILSLIALGSIFFPQGKDVFLAVGAGVSFLLLAIIGMQVPGQMLALASSKQFRHLADLRGKLCAISFAFWLSTAIIGCCFFYNLSTHKFTFGDMLSLAVAATSFIATTFTIIIARYPSAVAIYPLVFFIALPEFFKTFALAEELQNLYLWIGSAILWIAFYVWWKGWQPKKYLANAMTLSTTETKKIFEERKSAKQKFSSKPGSLSGSLLLGESDGILVWVRREIIPYLFIMLMAFAFIFWRDISPEKIPQPAALACLFGLIVGRGVIFIHTLLPGIYRLWMNTNQTRMEIFYYIEKLFFLCFIISVIPVTLFSALANHYVFDGLISNFHFGYLLLTAAFFVSYSYYLGLVIYAKLPESPMMVGWILMATFVCLTTGLAFFNLFWGWDISQNHADYLWCSGLLASLTILFRQWAKSSWRRVNFYRARS